MALKRPLKIAVILAFVLVVLVASLAVAVKLLITPERVKEAVLPRVEQALKRPVSLGEIEISLFTGIRLNELVVREPESEEPFLALDALVLRYRLWPLLFGRVEIDEVGLDGLRVQVVRHPDGRFNFSDLLPADEADAPEEESAPAPTAEGSPLALNISELRISRGEVRFVDLAVDPKRPFEQRLTEIGLVARDMALDRAFPFEGSLRAGRATLAFSGTANPDGAAECKVVLLGLEVASFAPYLREALPGHLRSLNLDLDLLLKADRQTLASRGKIVLRDLDLDLQALPQAPIRKARIDFTHDLALELDSDRLVIGETRLEFNGLALGLGGVVEALRTTPRLDLTATLPELDLAQLPLALPPGLVPELAELAPVGRVSGHFQLRGTPEQGLALLNSGSLTFAKAGISVAGLQPRLDGALQFREGAVSSQGLVLMSGGDSLRIDLSSPALTARPLSARLNLAADELRAERWLPTSPEGGGREPRKPDAKAEALGPFDLPLTLDGALQVGRLHYRDLVMHDLALNWRLAGNVLQITSLRAGLAEGTLAASARVDLSKPGLEYRSELKLEKVQGAPLVAAFAPGLKGSVAGILSLSTTLAGRDTRWEVLQNNLSVDGALALQDGRLSGWPLVEKFATYLALEELRQITFRNLGGQFSVRDGKARFEGAVDGSQLRLQPEGSIGLDGAVDLRLPLSLNPELTRKLSGRDDFSQWLADDQGWGLLPVKVSGSVTKPEFGLDTRAVRRQVQKKAEEKLLDLLDKRLFRSSSPAAAPPADQEAPADAGATQPPPDDSGKQSLRDAVKGLLGR